MDVASLTVKVVNEGLDETVKGLGDLGKEAGKTEKASDKLSNSFKKIQDDVKKNTGLSRELKDAVAQLNGAYLDSEGRLHGADGKYLKMTDSMKKAINEVDGLKDALKKQGEEAEKTGRSFEKLKGAVTGFNEKIAGLRNAALVGMGALTGVIYTSVNAAMDFESAMADVKKVVDFDTPDGLQKMSDDLLEMSTRIPIAADGLAQIAAAAGQSDIAANEISRFTEAAAKMGTAFDITAEQAGKAMAEMRVAFGFTQDEVETLADKINYLGNTTPNAAAGLTEVVQRIGAIAKISGVSADQLAAMAGSVTSLAPEVVATGLKNLMTRLTAGAAATKPMKAAWHDLGFTAQEVAKGMQEDSKAMINAVLSSLRKLPKEEQTAYLNTLFGQEALPVVAQLMTNTELLAENLTAMGDASKYAGSMQAEFEARSATTANQLELLSNNLNVAKITLGDAFLPMINDLAKQLIPVIEGFADWVKTNPDLVKNLTLAAGAIGGFILAVSGIGLFVSGLLAIANPVGLVVLAIGALIGIGVALVANWDSIKAKAAEVWEGIKTYVSDAWESIKETMSGFGESVGEAFSGIGESISEKFNAVKEYLSGVWESIKQSVVDAFTSVGDTLSGAFDSVKEYLSGIWESVKQQAIDAFNAMPEPVHEAVANIKEAFNFFADVWSAVQLGAQLAFEIVKSTASSAADWIITKWNSFKEVVSAIWQGVSTAASLALEIMKAAASSAVEWIKGKWSGFKDFMSGVWGGIVAVVTPAMDAIGSAVMAGIEVVKSVFSTAFNGLKVVVSTAMSAVKAVITLQWEGIKAVFVAGITILASIFNTGFNLVKNTISTVMNVIKALIRGDMKGVVDAFKTGLNNAVNIVKKGAGDIANAVKDLGTKLFKAGVDAVQGLINGIKSKIAGVKSAASELGQAAWGGVKSFLQIRSPSRKMAELGKNTAEGLAKGIKDNKKKPVSEAQKMAEQAVKAVKDTIATLQRDIALFGNDDPIAAMLWDRANTDKYKGVDDSLFNQAVDLTKQKAALELAEKFKEALKGIQDSINGSVSTELEKWAIALYGGNKELSKLKANKKSELLGEAANLDFSNLSKDVAKSNLEIDRQIELMGARTDLDKELLKIGYEANDILEKYNYYLESGQIARYNEIKAMVMGNAERKKGLAILKEQQRTSEAMNDMVGGLNEKSPLEKLQDEQDERLRIIQESMIAEGEMKQSHIDAMLAIDERYERDLQKLKLAQYGDGLSLFTQFMGSMLGENKRAKRIMFALEKGFALATVLIENKKALAKAWSSAPFPYNMALVAKTAMQTGALSAAVQAISPKGFKTGGYTGSIGANNIAGVVHGNEYVFDAQSTKAIGVENLERIRRGKNTGEVNITVNNHSSARVETETDSQGNIIMTIRDEVKRSWSNLQNANSHESKMIGRNFQAPRRR